MPGKRSDHAAFLSLHLEFPHNFKGYYLTNQPPVHSKVYAWYNATTPIIGFAGSANYSQYGFFETLQVNQISSEDPSSIKEFYDSLIPRTIFMPDLAVQIPVGHRPPGVHGSVAPGAINWEIPNRRVTISFLQRDGTLPAISGLNWGQRVENIYDQVTREITGTRRREPNQAYLSLKQSARDEGFLPEQALHFSLVTDDGQSFDCVVAQQGRKAIETTNNNSLLGIYFRNRIGIALGAPVTVEDLERYGRTDFTIEKINEETFLLDFSLNG